MNGLKEIETAVESLSAEEYSRFRQWFLDRNWERWDRQIESDSASGKLDFLIREARKATNKGPETEISQ
jgi:hypothetical protein